MIAQDPGHGPRNRRWKPSVSPSRLAPARLPAPSWAGQRARLASDRQTQEVNSTRQANATRPLSASEGTAQPHDLVVDHLLHAWRQSGDETRRHNAINNLGYELGDGMPAAHIFLQRAFCRCSAGAERPKTAAAYLRHSQARTTTGSSSGRHRPRTFHRKASAPTLALIACS